MLDKTVEIFHFSASFREEAQKSNVKKEIVRCFDGGGGEPGRIHGTRGPIGVEGGLEHGGGTASGCFGS